MRSALSRDTKLWKIWWLCGIPVAIATSVLSTYAELTRVAGDMGRGDLLDAVKLLIYLAWCTLAWRCSRNVDHAVWTPLARVAIVAGLVAVVMF